jgi:hypothetical protein
MNAYHEPERRAVYTDADYEKHGDAVLMTWREWVNLREVIQEQRDEIVDGRRLLDLRDDELAHVSGLDWVMRTMDETPP